MKNQLLGVGTRHHRPACATVTVTMSAGKQAAAGGHSGWLEIKSGATSSGHAAFYALIK